MGVASPPRTERELSGESGLVPQWRFGDAGKLPEPVRWDHLNADAARCRDDHLDQRRSRRIDMRSPQRSSLEIRRGVRRIRREDRATDIEADAPLLPDDVHGGGGLCSGRWRCAAGGRDPAADRTLRSSPKPDSCCAAAARRRAPSRANPS